MVKGENISSVLGSVINNRTEKGNLHCSPNQHLVVETARYGDYKKTGATKREVKIHKKCNALTNCEVKSFCGGRNSCQLAMINNMLPKYCSYIPKDIYVNYTCVDDNNSTIITTAHKIKLSEALNEGYILIKYGSIWRYVKDENWDDYRQKKLCQHLGFNKTDKNAIVTHNFGREYKIATGDLICYTKKSSGTSCCVNLAPSTTESDVRMPYVKCKICDNPILKKSNTILSGSGSEKYSTVWSYGYGWCASASTPYVMLDLRKEYHITRVVTMGNQDQTDSYTLKYSHNQAFLERNAVEINGNRNGYKASTTSIDIYNARYIKITSTVKQKFCLRIQLCGEVQAPAPAYNVRVTSYKYKACVKWSIRTAPKDSSYITNIIIYLNGANYQNISRGIRQSGQISIKGLQPYTSYNVEIQTEDGSFQKSNKTSKTFYTNEAVPSSPPANVTITHVSKNQLTISWRAPSGSSWNGQLTGYQVCYSEKARSKNASCFQINAWSTTAVITNLRPYTMYFVTIAAGTSAGYGPKSTTASVTSEGAPSSPPSNVAFNQRSKNQITISWRAPPRGSRNGILIAYQVCYSDKARSRYPSCFSVNAQSYTAVIKNLRPATKYFMTVAAATSAGYGPKSTEISEITRDGVSGIPPSNVAFICRTKHLLGLSWRPPPRMSGNGELTGYRVCYSDKARTSNPRCCRINAQYSTVVITNLRPATKYFVTVAAGTSVGFGPKSTEISAITNGGRVHPVPTSYSSLTLNVPKPAQYIKTVMVIVATEHRRRVERIRTNELKPYQANTKDPYITAYLKADVLPLTFVIGDGKEYNSEKEKYFNQPLKQNSSYFVFLRFFENQESYYSTGWSKSVKTLVKSSG